MRNKSIKKNETWSALVLKFLGLAGLTIVPIYLLPFLQQTFYCQDRSDCRTWEQLGDSFLYLPLIIILNFALYRFNFRRKKFTLILTITLFIIVLTFSFPAGQITTDEYFQFNGYAHEQTKLKWEEIDHFVLSHTYQPGGKRFHKGCQNKLYVAKKDGQELLIGAQRLGLFTVDQSKGKLLDYLATNRGFIIENRAEDYVKDHCVSLYYFPGKEV